ncbi:MAG: endonuclease/exonuclease/phosphatase family protein [Candidatus Kapaibacterium sp.]
MKLSTIAFVCSFATLFLLNACSSTQHPNPDTVTVATFNMEWLGDGNADDKKPRTEADYKRIAEVIEKCNADIIGVEEVENGEALAKVLKYVDGYSYYIGKAGRQQNVGVLYRNTVTVTNPQEYMPVATRGERNRPGFVVNCRKGNFDWTMMVLHLKSTSRADSTDQLREESYVNRREQAAKVAAWADSIVTTTKEKDVLIIGDLNDSPVRKNNPTLTALSNDVNVIFLTASLGSCKNSSWLNIDHIVASQQAAKRWLPAAMHHYNFHAAYRTEEANMISDHCPVLGQFEITSPDND